MRGAAQVAKTGPDEISEDMDYEAAKRMADRAVQRNACIQQSRATLEAGATSHASGYAAAGTAGGAASNVLAAGSVPVTGVGANSPAVDPC